MGVTHGATGGPARPTGAARIVTARRAARPARRMRAAAARPQAEGPPLCR